MGSFYAIQPSFAGGEISSAVSARVDLAKYQVALLTAKNAIIRAHGGVYKRGGMIYLGAAKYHDKRCRLVKFSFSLEQEYVLEFGHLYVRVWKNDVYTGMEVDTPFTEPEISNLNFTQSADVLYICSGNHPVQTLSRYAEDDWRLEKFNFINGPFQPINPDEGLKITPSAKTGSITLSASSSLFKPGHVGSLMKIAHDIAAKTTSASYSTPGSSSSIPIGSTWKIVTHGTWSGQIRLEISRDNEASWQMLRQYSSSNDFNAVESGDIDKPCLMRVIIVSMSSGTISVDLTAYPYLHDGIVEITGVASEIEASAIVREPLGDTTATSLWHQGSWSKLKGFPSCSTFWQDRLAFAASASERQTIWKSRSGDYPNFGVEEAGGQVTDGSAITLNLVSRQVQTIMSLVPIADLLALTQTAEWRISAGGDALTPSNAQAVPQGYRGASNVDPLVIGNRIVYIQERGTTVRDLGYQFDADSYTGNDLTLLARHLVEGKDIIDMSYAQEPDSVIWIVRNDGVLLSLTYLREQEVYAWSKHETDGSVESVCTIAGDDQDEVWFIVKRNVGGETKRYIERLDFRRIDVTANNYICMDSAVTYSGNATTEMDRLSNLEGKIVQVLADGQQHPEVVVTGGKIQLQFPAQLIHVGLPYVCDIETPNVEMSLKDGTMQGRQKKISSVILRLENSLGGAVGPDFSLMDDIRFEPYTGDGPIPLFSGDIKVPMPGGFNLEGRVCIRHNSPYPFSLQAIIKEVTLGG